MDLRAGYVDLLVIACETKVFPILVLLGAFFIIHFEYNFGLLSIFVLLNDLNNCASVPSTIVILTIDFIVDFQVHPPFEVVGLGLVGGDHVAIAVDSGGLLIVVVLILYFEFGGLGNDDFSSGPGGLAGVMGELDYIYEIVFL